MEIEKLKEIAKIYVNSDNLYRKKLDEYLGSVNLGTDFPETLFVSEAQVEELKQLRIDRESTEINWISARMKFNKDANDETAEIFDGVDTLVNGDSGKDDTK